MAMKKLAVAAALFAALGAGAASAQNWQLQPSQGRVELASGFQPDPYNVPIVSGGPIDAARTLGNACVGFVADAPDFDLYWQAGSGRLPLAISAASDHDTTLVIHAPDGRWYCNDDGGFNGFNPGIRFDNPQGGLYDIYVGTFGSNANYRSTLTISELVSN